MGRGARGEGVSSRLLHEKISALGCQANRPRPRALANADEKPAVDEREEMDSFGLKGGQVFIILDHLQIS